MAEYLHQKKGSSLWYYRRRYPSKIAKLVDAGVFMKSLGTTNKREAERRSRAVSVQFDWVCQAARAGDDTTLGTAQEPVQDRQREANEVLAGVRALMRHAASRAVEEQIRDPVGWRATVTEWENFHEAMEWGAVPATAQRPAIEARAILNGFDSVLKGQSPANTEKPEGEAINFGKAGTSEDVVTGDWNQLVEKALERYRHEVGPSRYKLAQAKLPQLVVAGCSVEQVQEALMTWCETRKSEVKPRTVKTQLDCMVSSLRLVIPKLSAPRLKWLRGVMQARTTDRRSMPVKEMHAAIKAFETRPKRAKGQIDYDGGAAQFDAVAIRALALLGLRPCELLSARQDALVAKTDFRGKTGLYFQVRDGKNRASERDIPLSDGRREVLDISSLREMLAWQEKSQRSLDSTRISLGKRFSTMTGGFTLYQMRHAWKDMAVHVDVDFELRERLLGHRIHGIAAVYGSGIPLEKGLDALLCVRKMIEDA